MCIRDRYYTPNALTITPNEDGSVKGQKYHHTIKINDKEGKYGQYEEKSDVVLKDEIPEGTEESKAGKRGIAARRP